jgi:RES domain
MGICIHTKLQEDKALYKTKHLEPRQWVRFQIDTKLHVIDVTDVATLRKIGADAATFLADYTVTQQWAKQLMEHPAGLDGFFYSSRLDGGQRCLAVFGRPPLFNAPAALQAKSVGSLLEDPDLMLFLARETVSII